jgi:hypothetical protein
VKNSSDIASLEDREMNFEGSKALGETLKKRKSIWEIGSGQHCSVIGTCFSIGEARFLGKKIGAKCPNESDLDSTIHSILVKESLTKNRISILINKGLNRKYENSIRAFRGCRDSNELWLLWRDAFEVGNIPGPYWAALSHPCVDYEVGVRIYSDVHMLSHLVGASNRANIVRLTELEIELASTQGKLQQSVSLNSIKLKEKTDEINSQKRRVLDLQNLNHTLEARIFANHSKTSLEMREGDFSKGVLFAGNKNCEIGSKSLLETSKVVDWNVRLAKDIRILEDKNHRQDLLLKEKDSRIDLLESELNSMELHLNSKKNSGLEGASSCDLSGKCVLYIGGRPGAVCRMCDLVEKMNGTLVHHDGGKENSLSSLAGVISSADAVVFPTDCISHSSALEAKKLCKRMQKPFVPVRSSGMGSLIKGLVKIQDQM